MADEDILRLYISFKEDARGWLSLHRQHFTQFVAIIMAVSAALLTAFFYFKDENWLLVVALGPALNMWLSKLAIGVCDKFYRRYLEHEAVSYKLYFILAGSKQINSSIKATTEVFPGDSHLFTQRWLERIQGKAEDRDPPETSDEFVDRRLHAKDASNRFIRITFRSLIGLNLVLVLAIVTMGLQNLFT